MSHAPGLNYSTIWKFPITGFDNVIEMPVAAQIVCFQYQDDAPFLWAIVDPNAPTAKRNIRVYGTGAEMPERMRAYIGTAQYGPFVWHAFEEFES